MDKLDTLFKGEDFREAVQTIVEGVCERWSKLIREELSKINDRVDMLEGQLHETLQINDNLKSDLASIKEELASEREEKSMMKISVETALQKANDNEQYGRLEGIRVHGVAETEGEDCKQKVCAIFHDKLGLDIKPSDISKIHRINQRFPKPGKARPIILRFVAHYHKRACILNRSKLKNTGIVIIEDLTQVNFGALNRAYNHELVDSAWSVEGKLFAKLKQGHIIRFRPFDNINDTIANSLKNAPHSLSSANATPIGSGGQRRESRN